MAGARRGPIGLGDEPGIREQARAGGDDQRALRAGDDRAERLDDRPVDLAVLLELREVVDERRMDHAVREFCTRPQAWQVLQVAPVRRGADGCEGAGRGVGAGKAQHLMPGIEQVPHDGGADEARGSGDEDAHDDVPLSWLVAVAGDRLPAS